MENAVKVNKSNLYSVDVAKFICAVSVVGAHTQIFSCFGELVNYYSFGVLFRLAVAFFFVCSGYFFFGKLKFENGKIVNCPENKQRLISYLKRIVILYIIWSVVYFVLQFIQWLQNPEISLFHLIISFAISFIVDGSYYHLWYILCLIYSIPIIYFLLIKLSFKKVSIIAVLLYVIHLIINLDGIVGGLPVVSLIGKLSVIPGAIGQTLFIAIPFVAIGGNLANFKCSKNKNFFVVMTIISLILLIAESSLIYFLSGKTDYSFYIIFTYITVIFAFLALKELNFPTKNPKKYSYLRNMSTLIYCVHPLVIDILQTFIDNKSLNSILWFTIVFIVTVAISLALLFVSKKLRILKYSY